MSERMFKRRYLRVSDESSEREKNLIECNREDADVMLDDDETHEFNVKFVEANAKHLRMYDVII